MIARRAPLPRRSSFWECRKVTATLFELPIAQGGAEVGKAGRSP